MVVFMWLAMLAGGLSLGSPFGFAMAGAGALLAAGDFWRAVSDATAWPELDAE